MVGIQIEPLAPRSCHAARASFNTIMNDVNHSSGDGDTSISWFKSSFCGDSNCCVEVQFGADRIYVSDSKLPVTAPRPVIAVAVQDWMTFLSQIREGAPAKEGILRTTTRASGTVLSDTKTKTRLSYTPAEWDAFLSGVRAGEFDPPADLVPLGCRRPSIDRMSSLVTIGTGAGGLLAQALGLTGPAAALMSTALVLATYVWHRRRSRRASPPKPGHLD